MVEYNKVDVRLSDSQLNKVKSADKNPTRVTLRINIKMFEGICQLIWSCIKRKYLK